MNVQVEGRKLELLGDVKEFREPCTAEQRGARQKVCNAARAGECVTLSPGQVEALWRSVLDDSLAYLHAIDELARVRAAQSPTMMKATIVAGEGRGRSVMF